MTITTATRTRSTEKPLAQPPGVFLEAMRSSRLKLRRAFLGVSCASRQCRGEQSAAIVARPAEHEAGDHLPDIAATFQTNNGCEHKGPIPGSRGGPFADGWWWSGGAANTPLE